jgi:hypothetical protein
MLGKLLTKGSTKAFSALNVGGVLAPRRETVA